MKLSRVSHCHSPIAKCGANGFPWKTLYRDSTGYSIRCCSSDCYAFRMMRNYFNSTFGKARRILGLTGAFMLLPFTLLLPLFPAGLGLALTANVNVLGGIIKRSVFEYITWFLIYYLFVLSFDDFTTYIVSNIYINKYVSTVIQSILSFFILLYIFHFLTFTWLGTLIPVVFYIIFNLILRKVISLSSE